MGKKKEQRRAIEADQKASPPALPEASSRDDELVQISMFLTRRDRVRLRKLGIDLNYLSLQRLGHRAWNSLLASYGMDGLEPVLTGVRGSAEKAAKV